MEKKIKSRHLTVTAVMNKLTDDFCKSLYIDVFINRLIEYLNSENKI